MAVRAHNFLPKAALGAAIGLTLGSCNGAGIERGAAAGENTSVAVNTTATETVQPVKVDLPPAPVPAPEPVGPTTFLYDGALTQGGWIRGQVPAGTTSARLGDQALSLSDDGRFFAAFDRDAGTEAVLTAQLSDGRIISSSVAVSPRDWNIERVNVARRAGGASASFMERRRPELAQIGAARRVNADSDGWQQDFVWPVKGRISGRFGSQRIYRGEPGSYHSGLDIATGESGTPFVSPADGVVTLATTRPFSLEGYLLIIDHGMGLNSAFLHASRLAVSEGDTVRQGQYIGNIGSTGRATGPHLHWGIKWQNTRLDPLLFVGPT
ncbi:putative metalloprotease [Alteripontixanthobacter maritimus]|uniref:Putative metalloprotease n=1 Tax=Alteripontixanthobacter maritimus TaxID=2161824 RepID=A0A369QFY4_9SPHN|nr:M23 family metallopeptidase [Alteripontixanthobacter maritimus]RDC61208.1 putative metalloprotease [Alteripontixanthobacter maritimus]